MGSKSIRIAAVLSLLLFIGALKLTDSAARETMGLSQGDSILGVGSTNDGYVRVCAMGSGVSLDIRVPRIDVQGAGNLPGSFISNIYRRVRGLVQEEIGKFLQNS